MPAPMPLEPPVTRATLPLNDFACIGHQTPLSHLLCPFWIILSRMTVQRDSFPGCPTRSFFASLWFSQRVHRQRTALDEPTSGLSANRKLEGSPVNFRVARLDVAARRRTLRMSERSSDCQAVLI